VALADLFSTGLPMNRKERFFTGTVLPMIACSNEFERLPRLLQLISGLEHLSAAELRPSTIQFFTEYGLLESIYGPAAPRFPALPESRDTPDVLIFHAGATKRIVALEAKMYDRPSQDALEEQLRRQREHVLDYLAEHLAVEQSSIFHAALLPEKLSAEYPGFSSPVVTWEKVRDAYADIASGEYFWQVLDLALKTYDGLAGSGRAEYGKHAHDRLTGRLIHDRFKTTILGFELMGRKLGIQGEPLRQDVESGRWRAQVSEVRRSGPPPNRNWFPVAAFVALVDTLTDSGS
jgi:hypothetical protein